MEEEKMVTVGRYKVAYWGLSKTREVYSQMFNDVRLAKEFAKQKRKEGFIYSIMELKTNRDGFYSWEIMKGGMGSYMPIVATFLKYRTIIFLSTLAYSLYRESKK